MLEKDLEYLSLILGDNLTDVEKIKSIKSIQKLKSLNLALTNLNDVGLEIISKCISLEYLNLQGTEITNVGISYLRNLKNLKILRLKDCDLIDDKCMLYLNEIDSLEELGIHETLITEKGLSYIYNENLKLIVLTIENGNFTHKSLIEFSNKLPNCEILVKGESIIKGGRCI